MRMIAPVLALLVVSMPCPVRAGLLANSVSSFKVAADLSRRAAQEAAVRQAAAILTTVIASTPDADGDAFPEPPPFVTGAGPAGGGLLPVGVGAPLSDGYGGMLGYCAWDNGAVVSGGNRLAGSVADTGAPAFAVVSSGLDGVFNRSCAEIAAGANGVNDDYVVAISTAQIRQGVGGTIYFADPVADPNALTGLVGLRDGELRLAKSDNTLWRWDATVPGWTTVSNTYTASNVGVTGGSINGTIIGNVTPASGAFTTLTGILTGNVTGNVKGNVTGNLTGDVTGNLNGNATTATRLLSSSMIGITGDATWSVSFDGSANVSGVLALSPTGVALGTYGSAIAAPVFAVDAAGRIVAAGNSLITPDWSAISGKPTTLGGYGISGIDGVAIGATTPSSGAFTTLSASGALNVGGAVTAASFIGSGAALTALDAGNIATGILAVARGGTGVGTTPANGQLLIGNGSGYTLGGLTGTANQIIVTPGSGSITLSLPQDIATTSTPTFGGLTLAGGLSGTTATLTAVIIGDGTVGSPGYAFSADPTTGLYRPATAQLAASVAGNRSMWITNGSVGLGVGTLVSDTSNNSTALGTQALASNTSGGQNVGVGYQSLTQSTTGNDNTAVGYRALAVAVTNRENSAFGSGALGKTIGNSSTAIGFQALTNATTGDENVAVGAFSLQNNVDGRSNLAVGTSSLRNNVNGNFNTALGTAALYANQSGGDNVSVGGDSMNSNTTGARNVAVGTHALRGNIGGDENVAIGDSNMLNNQTGSSNVSIGSQAMFSNTASDNTAVGFAALRANVSGTANTAMGRGALYSTSSDQNSAFGYYALVQNTAGTLNVAMGNNALSGNTLGNSNVAIGSRAGQADSVGNGYFANTIGSNNTFIGASAIPGTTSRLDYATVIGSDANVTTSKSVVLGRASVYASGLPTGDRTIIGATGDSGAAAVLQVNGASQHIGLASAPTGTAGMLYYNSVANQFQYYNGTAWNNFGAGGGTSLSTLTSASATNTLNNAAYAQNWNWQLSADSSAFSIGETAASSGGSGAQYLLNIGTLAGSTAIPLRVVTRAVEAFRIDNVNPQIVAHVGSAIAPSYGFNGSQSTGFYAPAANTIGASLNGTRSMWITTGSVALGYGSLAADTSNNSTALGTQALAANTNGWQNVGIGYQALQINTNGSDNTAVGYQTLSSLNGGRENSAFGSGALHATTASDSTAMGFQALYANTTGDQNTAIGAFALKSNQGGSNNVAAGAKALANNVTGGGNIAVGVGSLEFNVNARENVAIGIEALASNTQDGNTAIGTRAMKGNQTGGANTAVGLQALTLNTTADNNVAVGTSALQQSNANNNTAVGSQAMRENLSGTDNVALGLSALRNNVSSADNTAIGSEAMSNTTGQKNTAIGRMALKDTSSGYNNVALGWSAGYAASNGNATNANKTGFNNTFIGAAAMPGVTTPLSYATALGSDALVTTSGTIVLGRTTDSTVIGATADDLSGYKLQVSGGIKALTGGLSLAGGDLVLGSGTVSGLLSARPNFGVANRIYVSTDTNEIYRDTGSAWNRIAAGAAGGILASADFANQGTTTTVLHGNAAGNPSWSAVNLASDVSGALPITSGGTGMTIAPITNQILMMTSSGAYAPTTISAVNMSIAFGTSSPPLAGTIQLSLPQSVSTLSSPTYAGMTLNGQLTLATGTTALAPLRFRSGPVRTTPAAGSMEFDGTTLFLTNNATTRKTMAYTDSAMTGDGSGMTNLNAGNIATGTLAVARGGTGLGTTPTNGQLLIGNGSGYTLASLTGTANQIIVTPGSGSITLTLPQDIATTSTPTFGGLTLNGAMTGTTATFTNVKTGDGTVGAPGFTFSADATTGLYRPAANQLAASVAGTRSMWITAGSVSLGSGALASDSAPATNNNVAVGALALFKNTTGSNNTALGTLAGVPAGAVPTNSITGSNSTFVGANARVADTAQMASASNITLLGANTTASGITGANNQDVRMTAIGAGASVTSINTVVLGRVTDRTVIGSTADDLSGYSLQVQGGIQSKITSSGTGLYLINTIGGATSYIDIAASTYGSAGLGYPTNGNPATIRFIDTGYSNHIAFRTKNAGAAANPDAERMRLTADGKLLIGSATDDGSGSLLQVTGGVTTTGRITSSADYRSGGAVAIGVQGAYLQWNRQNGLGKTYLINQRGAGGGGISFGESTAADVYTENMSLSAAGALNVAGAVTAPSYAFAADATTRLYVPVVGQLAADISGTRGLWITASSTAIGTGALASGSSSPTSYNVAVGVGALTANTAGNENTAIGSYALYNNTGVTGGYRNSASGMGTLNQNTTGYENTASGAYALEKNISGNSNVASGAYALLRNTTGSSNAALGASAGYTATNPITGSYSTFVGAGASVADTAQMTSASNITLLGAGAIASGITGANNQDVHMTAIGAGASVTSVDTVVLGRAADNVVVGGTAAGAEKFHVYGTSGGTSAFATSSDIRYKTNITPVINALETIGNLKGVHYEFNQAAFPHHGFESGRQLGFIAQQIEPFVPEVVRTDRFGFKSVQYSQLVPLLAEGINAQQLILKHLALKDPATLLVDVKTFQANDAVFENIKATGIKVALLEAETARIKKLQADNIDSKLVRSDVVKSGEIEVFVSMGSFQPIFVPLADAQYIVNATADDGSTAFASVAFMGGKITVTPISGKGVDVTAMGSQVGLVAASKKIKATWIRMS